MRRSNRSPAGALVAAALLIASVTAPAVAATLREGSGSSGSRPAAAGDPGSYQSTDYTTVFVGTITLPNGDKIDFFDRADNLIDLINPTRANNTLCAMIYVFDADQEMGECCGCPITSNGLLALSVQTDLTDNWEVSLDDTGAGVIDFVDALPNNPGCGDHGSSDGNFQSVSGGAPAVPACNIAPIATSPSDGCDPSLAYSQTPNLSGYIDHLRVIASIIHLTAVSIFSGYTEVGLFDEGAADTTEQNFLIAECGDILGNGSGKGFCHCPGESD